MTFPLGERCIKFADRRKNAVVEENKKEFIVRNPKEKLIIAYHVDGCLIKQGKCCDYLVIITEDRVAHFIELKGTDIEKAVEQLNISIDQLLSALKGNKINAWIVSSRVKTPAIKSTKIMKLQKKLKQLNGKLEITTNKAIIEV